MISVGHAAGMISPKAFLYDQGLGVDPKLERFSVVIVDLGEARGDESAGSRDCRVDGRGDQGLREGDERGGRGFNGQGHLGLPGDHGSGGYRGLSSDRASRMDANSPAELMGQAPNTTSGRLVEFDLILGLMKRLMGSDAREDLRLVVVAQTVWQVKSLKDFLPQPVAIVAGPDKQNPVHVAYLRNPTSDYLASASSTIEFIVASQDPGDVLVILPNQDDCETLVRDLIEVKLPGVTCIVALRKGSNERDCRAVVSALSSSSSSSSGRKIVVATSLVDYSFAIPGIHFVIDSLLSRDVWYDAKSGLMASITRPISKARADQRTARAGWAGAGKCFRLCPESIYRIKLLKHDEPEIVRTDLVDVIVCLKRFGVRDVLDFPFPSLPSADAFVQAFEVLHALGVLNDDAQLTLEGEAVSCLPLPCRLAKMLISARWGSAQLQNDVLDLVSILATGHGDAALAMLTNAAANTLQSYGAREGDHVSLLNLFRASDLQGAHVMKFELRESIRSTRSILRRVLSTLHLEEGAYKTGASKKMASQKREFCVDGATGLLRCLVSGFFSNIAKLKSDGTYKMTLDGRSIRVHPSSVLSRFGAPPEWICFQQAVLTESAEYESRNTGLRLRQRVDNEDDHVVFVRFASAIDPRWLATIAPHVYETKREL